ncbi:DegV family EDD domain-containing protein [Lactobacillus parabuchneri]|uniref:DegV family EDD domain-containing protein n=1 Tax=Lentilactobacillus parabuchneri TaxID=152331 RepID=A0A844EF22_9LACO|nr:DegV family EDD domain-containing protein [Lentilactobacillus parabuchneri]
MTKVAIVTDSTAALSDDTVQKMANVFVVPIVVNMNGITYREGIDITNEQFYTALAKAKQLPMTAPPTPMEMLKVYDNLANQGYDDIISIHLTSGITGFVNNLTTVVRGYTNANVHVYDSHITIEPMGYLVKYASMLAHQGLEVTDIIDHLDRIRATMDEYFVVDDLKNLVTGGRLTNAAAFAGGLLRIKPILTLNEKYQIEAIGKIRTMKKALKHLEDEFNQQYQKLDYPIHVMLTGTNNLPAVNKWCADMKPKYPNASFQVGQIGPVVGTHLGSNAFVILWCKQVPEL